VTIRMRKTIEDLTPREMDVLRLMAQGLGNRDIAERLDVNERTIKSHVSTILSKFGVTNIANMTWDGIPLQSAHTFRAPAEIYLPLIRK